MNGRLVGVISDTHGLLRPEAIEALCGCAQIIHAGDIGRAEVLDGLNAIAPTVAVRGNVDHGEWTAALPPTETFAIDDVWLHVVHDLHDLDLAPAAAGIRVVVSGHSHQPRIEENAGVLYLNPGAAGPRRFKLPVTLAYLEIGPGNLVRTRLIDLLA